MNITSNIASLNGPSMRLGLDVYMNFVVNAGSTFRWELLSGPAGSDCYRSFDAEIQVSSNEFMIFSRDSYNRIAVYRFEHDMAPWYCTNADRIASFNLSPILRNHRTSPSLANPCNLGVRIHINNLECEEGLTPDESQGVTASSTDSDN